MGSSSPSATPYLSGEIRGGKRSQISPTSYDYSFKILVIGDSGVGKSSLLLSFISTSQDPFQDVSPTIGVDFKMKMLTTEGKRLKLTIWDTAGQERFGTLTSSYYRGAHGIILVYDVTRRETFTNLSEIWAREVELYSTNPDCVNILVGNKVDRDVERAVTVEEGMALAKKHNCLFYECSARTRTNVQQCFKDLTVKILDKPVLLEQGSVLVKRQILKEKQLSMKKEVTIAALNRATLFVVSYSDDGMVKPAVHGQPSKMMTCVWKHRRDHCYPFLLMLISGSFTI